MRKETTMAKRFLSAFGLVLLYLIAWVPILFLWITIWEDKNESILVVGVLSATVLIIIGFIPYLDFVAKRAFHFTGEGRAVSEEELCTAIKGINHLEAPVMVQERGKKLVATWKYVDAKWWEVLAKAGLTKVYELHMKFDERKKEVVLIDVKKSVSWKAGPSEVRLWGGFFRGVEFSYEIGKRWGIKESFAPGGIYSYEFSPQEIKNPIMNSILRNGWDVRFGIW
jgi:hypothetical protein